MGTHTHKPTAPRTAALRVTIVQARGLRDADWLPGAGKSDPYVQVEIPGKPHATFKTAVVSNSKDPVWNFTHDVQFTPGDQLVFKVYDSDPLKSDDLLGTATPLTEQFYPMGLAGEMLLEMAGKNVEAFLTINIEPCGAPVATAGFAQQGYQVMAEPVAGQSVFDMIDRNHDGQLTRAE